MLHMARAAGGTGDNGRAATKMIFRIDWSAFVRGHPTAATLSGGVGANRGTLTHRFGT
jgi:hypothetical protein